MARRSGLPSPGCTEENRPYLSETFRPPYTIPGTVLITKTLRPWEEIAEPLTTGPPLYLSALEKAGLLRLIGSLGRDGPGT